MLSSESVIDWTWSASSNEPCDSISSADQIMAGQNKLWELLREISFHGSLIFNLIYSETGDSVVSRCRIVAKFYWLTS